MKSYGAVPICGLIFAVAISAQKASTEAVITEAEIQALLAERIDQKKQSVGMVVGVIEDRGERIIAHGAIAQNDLRALDGNTVFELGSLTSVFTALLLSDMVVRGEVTLLDPVSKYLPPTAKMPVQGTRMITLADLATHTAGLPLLPGNFHPKNFANPYADYTEDDLYRFLAGYKLNGSVGTDYSYSNVGMGLLGIALCRRTGLPYETLVKTRILDPLGMKSSGIVLSPDMKTHLAIGHNEALQPVGYWDAPALPGAVALRSTTHDLLTFLEAEIGYRKTPLTAAMTAMLNLRRPTRHAGLELALGWHLLTTTKTQIVWHNGGTGGFRAFLGFSPSTKTGIVILSNTGSGRGVDDLGLRLFTFTPPDLYFAREHREIKVDARVLASYVGQYQLPDGTILSITQQAEHLQAKLGRQTFELTPESNRDFFVKNIEGQLTFVTDRTGAAYMLVMHQAGTDIPAKRVN